MTILALDFLAWPTIKEQRNNPPLMHELLVDQTFSRFPHFNGQHIRIHALEKGGSGRKFYRVSVGDIASLILAKYTDERAENRHYVSIARFLTGLGVRVPEIYFHDESEGLIWMEDLGDRDLWSYRHEPWEVRRELYFNALDQLVALHSRAHLVHDGEAPKLQVEFNAELYRWEQNYFVENCLRRYFELDENTIAEHCDRERLDQIAEQLAALPRCLVHRDFQSQNIVIKAGRACFIDFQGMRPGLAQYDLASLLFDPYVSLPRTERDDLLSYYLSGFHELGFEPAGDFATTLDLCAMQRLMQALGAYGFLGIVKERPHFLVHIPAAIRNLCEVTARIFGLESMSVFLNQLGGRRGASAETV